jgi:hypothetical protein
MGRAATRVRAAATRGLRSKFIGFFVLTCCRKREIKGFRAQGSEDCFRLPGPEI